MRDSKTPTELEFSKKYDLEHSHQYYHKHQSTLRRRLSNWREQQIARNSIQLAGNPKSILDLPCGTGRFWSLLAEEPRRIILAADNSQDMLDVALRERDQALTDRIKTFQTSAFDIHLDDNAVECIFCMRLLHHIGQAEHRAQMLAEFHRVSADTVVLSLWVDANYQAKRRARLEARREASGRTARNQNRFVIPCSEIEEEFSSSGFRILGHFDFLKYISMWRIYVLKRV